MKDYKVLDAMINNLTQHIKTAYEKGYEQGFRDGNAECKDTERLAFERGYNQAKEDFTPVKISGRIYKAIEDVNDEEYQRGLNDAWNCARKIYAMSAKEVIEIFGGCSKWVSYSASKAMDLIKKYEEKQTQTEKNCDNCKNSNGICDPRNCLARLEKQHNKIVSRKGEHLW